MPRVAVGESCSCVGTRQQLGGKRQVGLVGSHTERAASSKSQKFKLIAQACCSMLGREECCQLRCEAVLCLASTLALNDDLAAHLCQAVPGLLDSVLNLMLISADLAGDDSGDADTAETKAKAALTALTARASSSARPKDCRNQDRDHSPGGGARTASLEEELGYKAESLVSSMDVLWRVSNIHWVQARVARHPKVAAIIDQVLDEDSVQPETMINALTGIRSPAQPSLELAVGDDKGSLIDVRLLSAGIVAGLSPLSHEGFTFSCNSNLLDVLHSLRATPANPQRAQRAHAHPPHPHRAPRSHHRGHVAVIVVRSASPAGLSRGSPVPALFPEASPSAVTATFEVLHKHWPTRTRHAPSNPRQQSETLPTRSAVVLESSGGADQVYVAGLIANLATHTATQTVVAGMCGLAKYLMRSLVSASNAGSLEVVDVVVGAVRNLASCDKGRQELASEPSSVPCLLMLLQQQMEGGQGEQVASIHSLPGGGWGLPLDGGASGDARLRCFVSVTMANVMSHPVLSSNAVSRVEVVSAAYVPCSSGG
eukprot:gene28883-32075_t